MQVSAAYCTSPWQQLQAAAVTYLLTAFHRCCNTRKVRSNALNSRLWLAGVNSTAAINRLRHTKHLSVGFESKDMARPFHTAACGQVALAAAPVKLQ